MCTRRPFQKDHKQLETMAINNGLTLEAARAVTYFRFRINLLVLLSFNQCICILCSYLTLNKI